MHKPPLSETQAWFQRLSHGINIVLGSQVLEFMMARWEGKLGGPEWVWSLVGLIFVILTLCGFWIVTTPEPGRKESAPGVRLALWWCSVAGALLQVVDTAGTIAGAWAWDTWLIVAMPFLAIHAALFAVYLCSLARRVERPHLIWQTYIAFWGMGLGLLGFTACLPFLASLGEAQELPGTLLAFCGGSILLILPMGIWSLVLLWRYERAFAAAAQFEPAPTAGT